MFTLFPAIDLREGKCVRLEQGDFAKTTIYEENPIRMRDTFESCGAQWLHVVDLDGAKNGQVKQTDLISTLAQNTKLKLQVGGGIRDAKSIETLLKAGVTRVVIGSLAVQNPPLIMEWLTTFGSDKIILAFDVRLNETNEPELLTHGWQEGSNQSLWDILKLYKDHGLSAVLCTDISRDGMLIGTNHDLYADMRRRYPALEIIASGGVKNIEDLAALKALGASGAIIGKALYEGHISLSSALKAL